MKYFLFVLSVIILVSCFSLKRERVNSVSIKYKIAYNYLLKHRFINNTFEVSDTIINNRLSYFNGFLCKIDKSKLNLKKSDTMPSPEIIRVLNCIDSLDILDKKNKIVPFYFPLKKTLNNYNTNSDHLVHFSILVNNIVTVVVCQVRENNLYFDCDMAHLDAYYLKIQKDSVVEFYKQSIH